MPTASARHSTGPRPATPVVVDLTGVEYLDSAGLTVLFTHAAHIELVATPLLAPVLTISGLADITRLHETDPGAEGNGPQ